MGKRIDYGVPDKDSPEWTAEDTARAKPAREVFPPAMFAEMVKRSSGQRGPQKAPTKVAVTLRLDRDTIEKFKEGGPGWQTRMNATLKRAAARR